MNFRRRVPRQCRFTPTHEFNGGIGGASRPGVSTEKDMFPFPVRPAPPAEERSSRCNLHSESQMNGRRGGADLNLVSLALADQNTSDGRANRNLPVLRLCLMITYDLIYHLVAGIT